MSDPRTENDPDLVELALGLTTGADRDRVLAHVARCGSCRDELSALVVAATTIWAAPRPVEPASGFEQRVMAAIDPNPMTGTRRRPRMRVVAIAAALLLAVAAGAAGWQLGRDGGGDPLIAEYEETLRQLGGRALAGAGLADPDGHAVGHVFVYEGDSSWLFVELDHTTAESLGSSQPLMVFIDDELVGRLDRASWGTSLDEIDVDEISSVELRDAAGEVVARAVTHTDRG